ncbi:MAG: PaaI family thioesterase [Burkholderiaceae bacterium]
MNDTLTTLVPAGFVELPMRSGFMGPNGPLYGRRDGERMVLGFRVEPRHVNPRDVCHGGMLMLFADMLLPLAARVQADLDDSFFPTISLTTDFLAPAPLGSWVQGRADVMKVTRNMVFVQGVVEADEVLVARINGIFKRGGALEAPGLVDLRELFGRGAAAS